MPKNDICNLVGRGVCCIISQSFKIEIQKRFATHGCKAIKKYWFFKVVLHIDLIKKGYSDIWTTTRQLYNRPWVVKFISEIRK